MAFYDRSAAMHSAKCKDNFEDLIHIISKEGITHPHFLALEYINKLQADLKSEKTKVTEYEKFFTTLQTLLPKPSTISTIIR